ncbi:MAG: TerB family tellurite resistance protein [Burkholderiales bacterium]|jgi:uncharacterized tellurite resistance protein B-like protein|nr:TerB family tellurite resistance protein [Burkholderiales bacterium]
MQSYPNDSPEAMAQLLTALMAADDRIDDAEVEALGMLDAYARIGITPPAFADVLRDYFTGVDAAAGIDRVERIGERITDSGTRVTLWEMMVGLAGADAEVNSAEAAFLERIAALWWNGVVPPRLPVPGSRSGQALPQSILHPHAQVRMRHPWAIAR